MAHGLSDAAVHRRAEIDQLAEATLAAIAEDVRRVI